MQDGCDYHCTYCTVPLARGDSRNPSIASVVEQARDIAAAGFKEVACEFERYDYAISVDLPETADPATVAASLENGILHVTVKKRPETQARKIEIS